MISIDTQIAQVCYQCVAGTNITIEKQHCEHFEMLNYVTFGYNMLDTYFSILSFTFFETLLFDLAIFDVISIQYS